MPTTSVVEQFDILEQVTSYVIYCIIIPSVLLIMTFLLMIEGTFVPCTVNSAPPVVSEGEDEEIMKIKLSSVDEFL